LIKSAKLDMQAALHTRTDQTAASAIEAHAVTMQFGGLKAVDGMSIALRRGELLGLIGPNGAGKTTLFNLLAGSLRPTAGQIRIGHREVSRDGSERRIAHGLGRTFQIPRPFSEMTVLENVLTGGQDQAGERAWMNFLRPGKVAAQEKAAVAKARALLDFVTLSALEGEPARILSGGQRKLLELGRVLMADPRIILLDEPGAGVNPALLDTIIDRVTEINKRGVTFLIIEHNMDLIARLCPHVFVLAAGRMLFEGAPQAAIADPQVIEAYLGTGTS
jgi:branched-chain amino acid transport system ATP-binding protein